LENPVGDSSSYSGTSGQRTPYDSSEEEEPAGAPEEEDVRRNLSQRPSTRPVGEKDLIECFGNQHDVMFGRNQHAVWASCKRCLKKHSWKIDDIPTEEEGRSARGAKQQFYKKLAPLWVKSGGSHTNFWASYSRIGEADVPGPKMLTDKDKKKQEKEQKTEWRSFSTVRNYKSRKEDSNIVKLQPKEESARVVLRPRKSQVILTANESTRKEKVYRERRFEEYEANVGGIKRRRRGREEDCGEGREAKPITFEVDVARKGVGSSEAERTRNSRDEAKPRKNANPEKKKEARDTKRRKGGDQEGELS
jgi:hypothetical protein